MRWYSNHAVQTGLSLVMQNREVIWSQFPNSGDKPFWARKTKVTSPHSIEYWTTALNRNFNPMFGINIFHLKVAKKEE